MKIAVIGAGAMGSIYGGHLSLSNDVVMVDTSEQVVEHLNKNGLVIHEHDSDNIYHPKAVTSTEGMEPVDLIILFVKALYSRSALAANKSIIGSDTYIMTLQNGSGHEDIISEFVDCNHIIIGTTEDNGAVIGIGDIRRGGDGNTNIGMLCEGSNDILPIIKEQFDQCGFNVNIYADIRQLIWDKLLTNVSLSAVTGILQVDIGYISEDKYAWNMTTMLIKEAVAVARAMGLRADEEAICKKVRKISEMSPKGCTSIRADIRDGRRTEVDTISGSVVRAAAKLGIEVPTHKFVVEMIHAMEDKMQ